MITDERIMEIIKEETSRYITEKKEAEEKKDNNDKKVSKRDQDNIRSKVKARDGKNIINVSALARETGMSQSLVNRYIRGGVHDGAQGWVKYKMPKEAANKILNAMAKEKVG